MSSLTMISLYCFVSPKPSLLQRMMAFRVCNHGYAEQLASRRAMQVSMAPKLIIQTAEIATAALPLNALIRPLTETYASKHYQAY